MPPKGLPHPEEIIEDEIETLIEYIAAYAETPEQAKQVSQQLIEGIQAGLEAQDWQPLIDHMNELIEQTLSILPMRHENSQ